MRAQLPGCQFAAEYLVHSLPVNGGVLDVQDYLVLEISIYPDARETFLVSSGDFTCGSITVKHAVRAGTRDGGGLD